MPIRSALNRARGLKMYLLRLMDKTNDLMVKVKALMFNQMFDGKNEVGNPSRAVPNVHGCEPLVLMEKTRRAPFRNSRGKFLVLRQGLLSRFDIKQIVRVNYLILRILVNSATLARAVVL